METKIRYLVDTNVWLERLLDQEKSVIASKFFDLTIITFDKDFNAKGIKKKTPDEVVGNK